LSIIFCFTFMSPAPVRKLRAFDHFTAIVGKGREDAGTQPLMESANMRIRTYSMQDEQFAFHRALRSAEVRIQFRGARYQRDSLLPER
jgi:hypothetical protein